MFKRWKIVAGVAVFGVLVAVGCGYLIGQRGLPAQHGINNFGKVNERLYRGAQPDAAAIQNLKALGVKSIVNLRNPGKEWATEEAEALAGGIQFTNVTLKGIGRPTDEEILKILSLIESMPGPVYVHCQYGCDRTGTVIAAYRIKHDQWTAEAALEEADKHGMSDLERGMREFIRDFEKPASGK